MISFRSRFTSAALAAALILSAPAAVHAHKVNIFAYAEGGRVHTESYFADGGRASGCRVEVEDASGKKLIDGTTDENGIFVFEIPRAEDLKIVLHASMGHQNDYVIKADELSAALPEKQGSGARVQGSGGRDRGSVKQGPGVRGQGSVAGKAEAAGQSAVKATPKSAETVKMPASLTAEELRSVVDETVEARLKPVYGMLADIREASAKPSVNEVIGGIGYIMGILGIIAYFKSKKV